MAGCRKNLMPWTKIIDDMYLTLSMNFGMTEIILRVVIKTIALQYQIQETFQIWNKWLIVLLIHTTSKIFSFVINVRCFNILYAHEKKFQFGITLKIGCSDGLFTINTLWNMVRNHNLPNFVAFIRSFKAFDNAGHELLIKLLKRYSCPPQFFSATHRMYQYLIVFLNNGYSIE